MMKFNFSFFHSIDSLQGEYQRKLYKELMESYNRLERPVLNDSAPIVVELGLTLLQIIDVVSVCLPFMIHHTMHIPLHSVFRGDLQLDPSFTTASTDFSLIDKTVYGV